MMSLAAGWGPFGQLRRGSPDFDVPEHVRYVGGLSTPRARLAPAATVIDSLRVKLLSGKRVASRATASRSRTRPARVRGCRGLDGWVVVEFAAMETWHEEDGRVVGHVRDPYHRIDVYSTPRHVTISLDGELLARRRGRRRSSRLRCRRAGICRAST